MSLCVLEEEVYVSVVSMNHCKFTVNFLGYFMFIYDIGFWMSIFMFLFMIYIFIVNMHVQIAMNNKESILQVQKVCITCFLVLYWIF